MTEDPEVIGAGLVLLEGGFDYSRDILFPASGLQGNLLRAADARRQHRHQLDRRAPDRRRSLQPADDHPHAASGRRRWPASSTSPATPRTSIEDIVIATKIRLLGETPSRPAFGVRFATKLPNASNESGLGLDTTDFHVQALIGKTVRSVRIVGNVGLGILGDPTRGDNQNDVLLYGVSVARAVREGHRDRRRAERPGATPAAATPPVGTDSRGRHARSADASPAAPSASTAASCSA